MQIIEKNVITGETIVREMTAEESQEVQDRITAKEASDAAATDPVQLEQDCLSFLNGASIKIDLRMVFKAKVISDLAHRLGVSPITLTVAQINAERNRIAAIYKAL